MGGHEIFITDFNKHLQKQIVFSVPVPGTGMTNDIPVLRLEEQGAFPERLREWSKSQRLEEIFAIVDHAQLIGLVLLEQFCQVVTLACALRCDYRVDVSPFLRPHVAE